MMKAMKSFALMGVLVALLLDWCAGLSAVGATVKVCDAGGTCHTFFGTVRCADWGLAGGSTCTDISSKRGDCKVEGGSEPPVISVPIFDFDAPLIGGTVLVEYLQSGVIYAFHLDSNGKLVGVATLLDVSAMNPDVYTGVSAEVCTLSPTPFLDPKDQFDTPPIILSLTLSVIEPVTFSLVGRVSYPFDVSVLEFEPLTCTGDLTGDGAVSAKDVAVLLGAWGLTGPGDLDGNGAVDGPDLAILLGAWGAC